MQLGEKRAGGEVWSEMAAANEDRVRSLGRSPRPLREGLATTLSVALNACLDARTDETGVESRNQREDEDI
jgi:hypothetical protein